MKKIVVMSDNHGLDEMIDVVLSREPNADYYVHCGDSEVHDQRLLNRFISVKGNNDWALDLPKNAILEVEDLRIMITHGHFYGYFNKELHMIEDLKKNNCTVMLSGHTHIPSITSEGQYYFINPGSTTLPRGGSARSYAVLWVDGNSLRAEIIPL